MSLCGKESQKKLLCCASFSTALVVTVAIQQGPRVLRSIYCTSDIVKLTCFKASFRRYYTQAAHDL